MVSLAGVWLKLGDTFPRMRIKSNTSNAKLPEVASLNNRCNVQVPLANSLLSRRGGDCVHLVRPLY